MKVSVDTNVLVRATLGDDPAQAHKAIRVLRDAELIAVAMPCLCELVWVLLRVYGLQASDAAAAIRALLACANVEINRPAAEAGLAEKPLFHSTKKRSPCSWLKGNQHAFYKR